MNASIQFRDAILSARMDPPIAIEPGKFHRFSGVGKQQGNKAGWCLLFEDRQGGCFGDWSSGLIQSWQAKPEKNYTPQERAAFLKRVEKTRHQADTIRQYKQAHAAKKALELWHKAKPANKKHPYLIAKKILPYGIRQFKGALIIPIFSVSELSSLQLIFTTGEKRFLPGGKIACGYYLIGTPGKNSTLCIAEGFATGASIYQATGYPVAVAFNAGNLISVAKSLQQQYSDAQFIICGDDDRSTPNNPGRTKAQMAAQEVGGKLALPVFSDETFSQATDFNDMAKLEGMDAVANAIATAEKVETPPSLWPEPLPLVDQVKPAPYPLDALPPIVLEAVKEVQTFTKAPVPLIAASALSALSLAAQAQVDIQRAEKLTGPASLFFLTIADSGERKSTCDKLFTQVIRDFQANQRIAAKPKLTDYQAEKGAWESIHSGIKDKLRQCVKKGEDTEIHEKDLREHEYHKPKPPKIPHLIFEDATSEALKWKLANEWPAGGIISSEAGIVLGSHGMGKDNLMRYLTTLNQLWDGSDIITERRTSESFTVENARLTIALQIQESTLRQFLSQSQGLPRGTGFLSRCLLSWPESTQGQRFFVEQPNHWPALEKFKQRLTHLLEQPVPFNDQGALLPLTMVLSQKAKQAWIDFYNAIESQLHSNGELYDIRDVASKSADNATRIAALFQLFEHGSGSTVELPAFEGASRIAAWHLHEARRFYGELGLSVIETNALKLQNWLLSYCRTHNTLELSRRDIQRNVIPTALRKGELLTNALSLLADTHRVREIKKGQQKHICINPALLEKVAR